MKLLPESFLRSKEDVSFLPVRVKVIGVGDSCEQMLAWMRDFPAPGLSLISPDLSIPLIRSALENVSLLFIVVDIDGTSKSSVTAITTLASALGVLTVGVVAAPTYTNTDASPHSNGVIADLSLFEANVDSLLVMPRAHLMSFPDVATAHIDAGTYSAQALRNLILGTSTMLNVQGLVGVDFEDVRTVLGMPGHLSVSTATSIGVDRASSATELSISRILEEIADPLTIKGVMLLISFTGACRYSEVSVAMNAVFEHLGDLPTHRVTGTSELRHLADAIQITLVTNCG